MGRSRYKITEPQQAHFVTLTVLHWIPVFTRPETVNILLDSLRFLSTEGLNVYAWVIFLGNFRKSLPLYSAKQCVRPRHCPIEIMDGKKTDSVSC
jgi:hypothetical protein